MFERFTDQARRVVQGRGLTLEQLRGAVLAQLHAAT